MTTSTALNVRRCAARDIGKLPAGVMAAITVVFALLAPGGASAADSSGSLKSAGTLTLILGTDPDQFVWTGGPSGSPQYQLVKDARDLPNSSPKDACALALVPSATSSDALVTFAATSGGKSATPGFNAQKNWIGVREQARGVDCGRVSPQQSVVLSLAGRLNGYAIKHTKFQVNVKKNVVIKAHLTLKGGNAKDFYLYTGLSTATAPQPDNGDDIQFCEAGISDSSPDSNANCTGTDEWEFDWVYDRAEFSTYGSTGEWSIAGPTASEFELVEADGVIDCGDKTVAVGDGIAQPFAQCTRLDNVPSTLPGGPGADNCQVVAYSLNSSCSSAGCNVTLLHGLSGTQDATQFKFLCTANWTSETLPTSESFPYLSNLPLSQQFWGPDDSPSTRPLDYCPGATVETDPAFCEPGTVAVTSSSLSYGGYTIASGEGGLDAFQIGNVITVNGVVGYYKVASVSSMSLGLDMTDDPLSASATNVAGTITRVSGCPIVDFSFANLPMDLQDMSTTLPGKQRGCLLEEQITECNVSGGLKACLEQTWGWEGDATVSRFR